MTDTPKTRAEIRSAIFASANMKPKSKTIEFFGVQIEIKQLDLNTILDFRNDVDRTPKDRMVDTIVAYGYVPDTDERVFEEADKEQLLVMPFGADFQRLQKAITELTNVDIGTQEATGNSVATV